jgi:Co/Zn/Cd efflux system component
MRSTWLCSRNDIIANLSVLVAAIGVKVFGSGWPDILVGVAIAALFLKSAFTVLRESLLELAILRSPSASAAP